MRRIQMWGATLLVFAMLAMVYPARAELMSALNVADRLGLSKSAIERVKQGEVVVEEIEASHEKDLSIALVAAVDAPHIRVFEFVDAEKIAELSAITLSRGPIDTSTFSLAEMTLPDDVMKEFLDDPAGTFFMSKDEAAKVSAASEPLVAYQAVLSARAKAYWQSGASAIVSYEKSGRSPKADLEAANEAARKIVTSPAVLALLDEVPSKADGTALHELFWAVQKGRDQAAPVLSHRILYKQDDGQIFIEKRFYSGYDYDALQILVGVLPVSENRSVIFYTNHTYTQQVAGFGGGAKRSIGRKLMSKELVKEIERTRKALETAQ